jgi:dynein heavy chain 2
VQAASSLLGKLGGEKDRWDRQVRELRAEMGSLPVGALLAAACVTYLGNASEDVRASTVRMWSDMLKVRADLLPCGCDVIGLPIMISLLRMCYRYAQAPSFNLLRFLSSESEQLQWKAQGLPADGLFMENAVMLQYGTLTPLVLDPGSQATAWLVKKLGGTQGSSVETVAQQVRFVVSTASV